jgi:TolB-like protein
MNGKKIRVVRKLQFLNNFLIKTHFCRALARKNTGLVREPTGFPNKPIIVCVLLTLLSVKVFSQSMTLDEAIRTTASELGQRINAGRLANVSLSNQSIEQTAEELRQQLTAQIKIAVLNFSSSWRDLSAYVIDELNNAIVREGKLTVVDRQQLDLVRREQNFQMSGEVSDESAQSIGKFLGAQLILSGSFTVIGDIYRFRIRVIAVETGVVQYSNSIDINKNDPILPHLMPKPQSDPIDFGFVFFNGLTLFGYTYSPDKPLGFSLGVFGIYTSLGFAVPIWGDYNKTNSSSSFTDIWGTPDYSSTPYTDQRHEIVDWVVGYNVTILPTVLYMPIGVGTEAVREWRLQDISGDRNRLEWNPAPQWETSLLFEAGLLFRIPFLNFAPYLYGTYRNIGTNKHSFSIGVGGSFDFLGFF